MVIQRKTMGREEKEKKEERDDLAPKQNSWICH
jgi:hypothetical protein